MTHSRKGAGTIPARRCRATSLLTAIVGLSVVLRLAAAVYLGNSVDPFPGIFDQVSYHTLAVRVLEGHGFSFATGWWPATPANQPTAHWSFLYVLFLAAVYGIGGPYPLIARLIQATAVGVLQPLLTYRLTARLFGERAGVASAGIVAVYAYFVYYAAALLTESFFIVAMLWALERALGVAAEDAQIQARSRRWLQLGAALAIAVLLRQVAVVIVPLIVLWTWWRAHGGEPRVGNAADRRRRARSGAVLAVSVVLLAVLPWSIRNYGAFRRFVPLNTNAGFAFYWGNHPVHGTQFVPILPDRTYAALIPSELRGLNEADLDRALLRRGFSFVLDAPARFLVLSASRIKEYLKFWPARESGRASNYARVLSFGVCLPFMIAGAFIALWPERRWTCPTPTEQYAAAWLLFGVAGIYSLVHLLAWALVRYRLPVDAVLLPFAALAMVAVSDQLVVRTPPSRRKRKM